MKDKQAKQGKLVELVELAKHEAMSYGFERGYSTAELAVNEDDAFEAELNSRQYSPFEFFASDVNKFDEPDALDIWQAYEHGVSEGIRQAFKERRNVK